MTIARDHGLRIEAADVQDQRIAVPVSDGVAHVRGGEILGVLTADRCDAELVVRLVHYDESLRRVHDLKRKWQ